MKINLENQRQWLAPSPYNYIDEKCSSWNDAIDLSIYTVP